MSIFIKRVIIIMGWISIFTGIGLVVLFTYWFTYPYKVLEFKEGNGTVYETTVKSGGTVRMQQNSCKYMNLPSVVDRQFVDGLVHQLPPTNNNRPTGCHNDVEYIYIPKALPEGPIRIRTTISFKPNPIRTIVYVVESTYFVITK